MTAGTCFGHLVPVTGLAGGPTAATATTTTAVGHQERRRRTNCPRRAVAQSPVHGIGHPGTGAGRRYRQLHVVDRFGVKNPHHGIALEGIDHACSCNSNNSTKRSRTTPKHGRS